ncbi:MAG: hypothetical protein EHM79_19005 [Geobacter sp.]|nr:MAG: hypothetical protein EHM79_19005 [Geobacter sp.]
MSLKIDPRQMIRKYLPYFNVVFTVNLVFSFMATVLSTFSSKPFLIEQEISLSRVISQFIIFFLTGGYLIGAIYYEIARKNEYYLYYNLGISKLRLNLRTYLFHLILMIPFLIFAIYAKQI